MKRTRLAVSAMFLAAAALAVPGRAAAMEEVKAHVGGGVSMPVGDLSDALDTGWRINGGATFYPSKKPVGFRVDLAWDWWNVKDSFLDNVDTDAGAPGNQPPDHGDAYSIGTTFNVLWEPETSGTVGWYLTGGVGGYYVNASISNDGTYYGYVCDPWYWWYCYPAAVPGQYEIKDHSQWEWGLNGGVGITFELSGGSQFYVEANYQWLDTKSNAAWVPLQFGWRW